VCAPALPCAHIYLFSQQQLMQREILRCETRSAHRISQIIMLVGKGSFHTSISLEYIPLVLLFMKSVKFYYANYIFCLFAPLAGGCVFPRRRECKFAFPPVSCWLEKGACMQWRLFTPICISEEERVLERKQISRFSARMNILLAPGSKREKKV
jgi:hypothetical protein